MAIAAFDGLTVAVSWADLPLASDGFRVIGQNVCPESGVMSCPAGRVAVSNPHVATFEPVQNVCPEPARTRYGTRRTGGWNVPDWWNEHSTMPQMPRDDEEERFDQRREDQVALQEQRLRRVSLDWLFSKDSQAERRMPARSLRRANTLMWSL